MSHLRMMEHGDDRLPHFHGQAPKRTHFVNRGCHLMEGHGVCPYSLLVVVLQQRMQRLQAVASSDERRYPAAQLKSTFPTSFGRSFFSMSAWPASASEKRWVTRAIGSNPSRDIQPMTSAKSLVVEP